MKPGLVVGLVGFVLVSGCAQQSSQAPASDLTIRLEGIGRGFDTPVFATSTGGEALYVVEQGGRILTLENGRADATPFLDIRSRVGSGGERGLLGLAFDPEHETNGRFFVHYNDKNGDTVLARYTSSDGEPASAETEQVLLEQDQPYANHNGGMIAFRGEFLYMGLGDGGSAGDPQGNGQKLSTVLGKILRLDVSGDTATCPASNPKLGEGSRCEIWSYGLRNPWRFSFDRQTGDLFIGDVGQNQWEEIDYSPASSPGGENYGWNVFEGRQRFRASDLENHVPPISDYATGPDGTCAVTGGYVYRGEAMPSLQGRYVFGDYCSGTIWTLQKQGGGWSRFVLLETDLRLSSFGEDADGEILVIDHGGEIYRIAMG